MNAKQCRAPGCGVWLAMARTEAGKLMPVEVTAAGALIEAGDGRQVAWTDKGRLRCRTWQDWDAEHGLQDWETRVRDHYQSCTRPQDFSRRTRAARTTGNPQTA